jgi:hypothetical protein
VTDFGVTYEERAQIAEAKCQRLEKENAEIRNALKYARRFLALGNVDIAYIDAALKNKEIEE